MPGYSDGSIVIDTELDSSGIEKGSKKAEAASNGLADSINKLGKTMAQSVAQGTPSLQNIAKAAQQASQTMQKAGDGAATFGDRLKNAVASGGFDKSMSDAERACTSLQGQLNKLGDSERMGVKTSAQMARFELSVEKARQKVDELRGTMSQLGEQNVTTPEYEQLTASIEKAQQALFRLYDRRDMAGEMGVKETSAQWQRMQIQIRNAEAELERLEAAQKRMQDSGIGMTAGVDSERYQKADAQLQQMMGELQRYEQIAAGFGAIDAPAEKSTEALKKVDDELRQKPKDAGLAQSALTGLGSVMKTVGSTALGMGANLGRIALKPIANGIGNLSAKMKSFVAQSTSTMLSTKGLVKSLTSLKTMLVSRVKRMFISAIMKNMQAAVQSLARYSAQFNASMSGMQNAASGLTGNLAVSFGSLVNAIAPAITTVINLISTAVTYLNSFFALLSGKSSVTRAKKQTDSYAASMGGAAKAAKELKNEVYGFDELNKRSEDSDSGGGGGGGGGGSIDYEDVPISEVLPESVQQFFQKLIDAFKAGDWEGVGRVVAEGINSVVYSIDDWINNTLAPIALMWTERIARILNGLVDGLDWDALGGLIASGLNLAFGVINTFLTTFDFVRLGEGLATGLNGLVNSLDWALVGQTFANKWNALIDTIYGFVTQTNWASLGTSIGTGIRSWFETIDWETAAANIAIGINGIAEALRNLISEVDIPSIGMTLGERLNEMIGMIHWDELGALFGEGIDAIVQAAYNFMHKINFTDFGTQLSTMFNNGIQAIDFYTVGELLVEGMTFLPDILIGFFSGLNWGAVAQSVSGFIMGVLDGMTAFFQSHDWSEIGESIWQALMDTVTGIDYDGIASSLFSCLGAAIRAAVVLVGGFVLAIVDSIKTWFDEAIAGKNWSEVATALLNAIGEGFLDIGMWVLNNIVDPFMSALLGEDTWAGLKEAGKNVIEGLLNGIIEFFSDPFGWVKEHIVDPFISGFKSLFGISSPSTVMNEQGGFLISGLLGGITETWGTVTEWIGNALDGIKKTVSGAWDKLKTATSSAWNGIKTTVSNALDKTKSAASKTTDKIKSTLSAAWDSAKDSTSKSWESMKDNVSTTFTVLKDVLSITADNIKTMLSTAWENAKTTASNTWTNLKNTVSTTFTSLKTSLTTTADTIKTTLSTAWENAKTTASNTWTNLKNTVSTTFTNLKTSLTTTANTIKTTLSTAWENAKTTASSAWESLKNNVSNAFSGVTDMVGSTLNALKTNMSNAWDSIKRKASDAWSNIKQSINDTISSLTGKTINIGVNIAQTVTQTVKKAASAVGEVASNVVNGVVGAVNSAAGAVKGAGKMVGGMLTWGAEDELDINSPSKVFTRIGEYAIEGLRVGIENAKGAALKTVSSVANAVSDGMRIEAPMLDSDPGDLVGGIDRVADALSRLADIFSSISSALAQMGGLKAPAIATGSVVPYRTRLSEPEPEPEEADTRLSEFSSNFDETMSDQRELLQEIVELLRKLRLVVDEDSLVKAITALQHDRERSYGY